MIPYVAASVFLWSSISFTHLSTYHSTAATWKSHLRIRSLMRCDGVSSDRVSISYTRSISSSCYDTGKVYSSTISQAPRYHSKLEQSTPSRCSISTTCCAWTSLPVDRTSDTTHFLCTMAMTIALVLMTPLDSEHDFLHINSLYTLLSIYLALVV